MANWYHLEMFIYREEKTDTGEVKESEISMDEYQAIESAIVRELNEYFDIHSIQCKDWHFAKTLWPAFIRQSKEHPDLHFEIVNKEEDPFKYHLVGGLYQYCKGQLVFEEFSKDKLKEPENQS
jgi:hypothetical protein